MLYTYRSKNKQGQEIEGSIEAPTKNDAIKTLSEQGLIILSLEAQGGRSILNINLPFPKSLVTCV